MAESQGRGGTGILPVTQVWLLEDLEISRGLSAKKGDAGNSKIRRQDGPILNSSLLILNFAREGAHHTMH